MKALTLHQPWASLLANGVKHFETRSWACPQKFIGRPIAIHAAKTKESLWTPDGKRHSDLGGTDWGTIFNRFGIPTPTIADGWLGHVLSVGVFVSCHEIFEIKPNRGNEHDGPYEFLTKATFANWLPEREEPYPLYPTRLELQLGGWEVGRYAWRFQVIQRLSPRVQCKGGQRIWTLPSEAQEKVYRMYQPRGRRNLQANNVNP